MCSTLCFKSGNACLLKGGSDADCLQPGYRSRRFIRNTLLDVAHLSPYLVVIACRQDHDSAAALLHARGYVDSLIPRGRQGADRLCAAERH